MFKTLYNYYKIVSLASDIYRVNERTGVIDELSMLRLYELVRGGGCVCIKFFQWILPLLEIGHETNEPWFKILERIYDDCNIHGMEHTLGLFREENGYEFNERYELQDIVASGSIGQVYRIKEIYTGKILAMKVLHPNIARDILHFKIFSKVVLWIPRFKSLMLKYLPIDITGFIRDFEEQTSMITESRNMNMFLEAFSDSLSVYTIPKPISYTKNTLIMSYHESTKFDELECSEYQKSKIIRLLVIFMWNSHEHNMCHEDIHKGNWGVQLRPDNSISIVIYDYGLCTRLLGEETRFYSLIESVFVDNGDTTNGIDSDSVNGLVELTYICVKDIGYDITQRYIRKKFVDKSMLLGDAELYIKLMFELARDNNKLVDTHILKHFLVFSQLQSFIAKYYQVIQSPEQEINQSDSYRISIPDNYALCETENICKIYRDNCLKKLENTNTEYENLFLFTSETVKLNTDILRGIKQKIDSE
tara:strand:+ start:1634 stop:3061 length:1428 start_codon:yes stop_codon:yes gene_type:complete